MLSTRGAITTNKAMFECVRCQNMSHKEVFLLSELEKVWVSICVIARRLLLEGRNVRIGIFGSFWTVNRLCITDSIHRERYYLRRLCFGLNAKFVNQYGMDNYKVPLEKNGQNFTKINTADVVSLSGIPASTVSMALQEYFMYIGEGLYCGRVFNLYFPGIATMVLKKERMMLVDDPELVEDMFEADTRKWPIEKRLAGRQLLDKDRQRYVPVSNRASVAPKRRCTQPISRVSSRSGVVEGRPVFVSAAPVGRLFSEIEKDAQQHLKTYNRCKRETNLLQHQNCSSKGVEHYDDAGKARCYKEVQERLDHVEIHTYYPTVRTSESVYEIVEEKSSSPSVVEEPEIETVEVSIPSTSIPHTVQTDNRFISLKNPTLEKILIEEEPFSRTMFRHTFHNSSSARDLIYGGAKPDTTHSASMETHYGRKRFDKTKPNEDKANSLLKVVN